MPPWQRSFTLILSLTVIRVGGSQLVGASTATTDFRKKGRHEHGVPDVIQSSASSPSSSSVVKVGTLPKVLSAEALLQQVCV